VLREIGRCASGTTLVFTYVHRGLLDGTVPFEGAATMLGNVRGLGEPWTFGIDPQDLAAFVGGAGLIVREDVGADDYRARHLPREKAPGGYAFYRIAIVERP